LIKLQVLLRKPWRNPEGVAIVQSLVRELGIEPTVSGTASVSAEAAPEIFKSVFGDAETQPLTAGKADTQKLPIPGPLQEYVESIAVAPRHILFRTTPESSENKG